MRQLTVASLCRHHPPPLLLFRRYLSSTSLIPFGTPLSCNGCVACQGEAQSMPRRRRCPRLPSPLAHSLTRPSVVLSHHASGKRPAPIAQHPEPRAQPRMLHRLSLFVACVVSVHLLRPQCSWIFALLACRARLLTYLNSPKLGVSWDGPQDGGEAR
ncbi:hypothetical protein BKA81DRAFT_370293 [Phyllosticta paracitricarpa]